MDKKKNEEEAIEKDSFTDNLADDMPKEQISGESGESVSEETEVDKWRDSYMRLAAEYDNYRKRTVKEKADLIKNGGEKILVGLLPVIDDFQRALETVESAKDLDSVKKGIELIYAKFMNFLQQNGVKPIETDQEFFDEDKHEAVAVIPAQNEAQKGAVVDSVQKGYTLHDKVIRHSKVVVAN